MRKVLILFLTVSIILPYACFYYATPVIALSHYRRVITQDTPFYSDSNGNQLLFYLPYTYYVKALSNSGELTHVECYGNGGSIALDGYVPTELLFDDGLQVTNPYLTQTITTVNTAVLYNDYLLSTPIQYLFPARDLDYYGSITLGDGSLVFYVGYNNKLGYVKESDVYPFSIANHPNELTFIAPEPEIPPEQTQKPDDSSTDLLFKIGVTLCLLLAGVIALIATLKHKPKQQTALSYYDENDYE